MMNPDGVALGNYRADGAGADLNRMWLTANAFSEPSVYHVLGLLQQCYDGNAVTTHSAVSGNETLPGATAAKMQVGDHRQLHTAAQERLAVFIDIHAHSTSPHSFLFCNSPVAADGSEGSITLPRYNM